jgi:hypothetical protein
MQADRKFAWAALICFGATLPLQSSAGILACAWIGVS